MARGGKEVRQQQQVVQKVQCLDPEWSEKSMQTSESMQTKSIIRRLRSSATLQCSPTRANSPNEGHMGGSVPSQIGAALYLRFCGGIWILASKSKFLNAVDWLTSLRRDAAYYKLETVEYSNSDVMQSLDLEDGWGR